MLLIRIYMHFDVDYYDEFVYNYSKYMHIM